MPNNIGEVNVALKVDQASLNKLLTDVKSQMEKTGKIVDELGKRGTDSGKKMADGFSKAGKSAGTFGDTLKALFTYDIGMKLADGLKNIGVSSIKLAADLEQTRIAFTTMTGDARIADAFIRDMTDFAKKTPFEIGQIETASKQLLAYGIDVRDVIPDLKMLGDIAAGVGMDKMPNLILAFGQVSAATRLTGMELRQFTEAGVPLLDELTKVTGKSVQKVQDMVSKGQIGFPIVQKALENLTKEGGRFYNLMEKQSQSFGGMISNFQDTITIMLRDLGTEFLPDLKKILGEMLTYWDENGKTISVSFVEMVKSLVDVAITGFSGLGEIVAASTDWITEQTGDATSRQGFQWKNLFLYISMGVQAVMLALKVLGAFIGYAIGSGVYDAQISFLKLKTFFKQIAASILATATLIGTNIAAAIGRGIQLTMLPINALISALNLIPGVQIPKIGKSLSDIAFISLSQATTMAKGFVGVTDDSLIEISNLEKKRAEFQKGMAQEAVALIKSTADKMSDEYAKFNRTQDESVQKGKTLAEVLAEVGAKAKLPPAAAGDADKAGKKGEAKKEAEEQTRAIDKLKEAYDKLQDTKKQAEALDKTIQESSIKRYQDIRKELNKISDDIKKNEEERAAAVKKINEDAQKEQMDTTDKYVRSLVEKQVEGEKTIDDLNKQLSETSYEDYDKRREIQEKIKEEEKKLTDIRSNISNLSKEDIKNSSDLLNIERERAKLSEEKRMEYDYNAKQKLIQKETADKIAAENEKAAATQASLEQQQRIYEYFQKRGSFTEEQLAAVQKTKLFEGLKGEEQNLFLKLANELIQLTDQKNKKIALEKEVSDAAIALANRVQDVHLKNISKLKLEYQDLIKTINETIAAQRELEARKAASSGEGFAEGGYTGNGGKHDVAGVVHRGEYVLSQAMLAKMPSIIPALESIRSGSANYDQSRSVNITGPINMQSTLDFDSLITRAKFIM